MRRAVLAWLIMAVWTLSAGGDRVVLKDGRSFDGIVTLSEDIGRHNAVDKVIGTCLLRGMSLTDKVLLTSGRASYEMVTKAIRLGIPIVASISAPTALAVQLSEDRGLTLIGYLRGSRMNVYTHPERIRDLHDIASCLRIKTKEIGQ